MTTFLELCKAPDSRSERLFASLEDMLSRWGVSDKVCAFGSDGASNMVGAHSGLAARTQGRLRHMLGIHCILHGAEL